MKIFQVIQKNLALDGFTRDQSDLKRNQIKQIYRSISIFTLQITYLFHIANTSNERIYSICIIISCSLMFISSLSVIFKADTVYHFIDDYEQVADESEC